MRERVKDKKASDNIGIYFIPALPKDIFRIERNFLWSGDTADRMLGFWIGKINAFLEH